MQSPHHLGSTIIDQRGTSIPHANAAATAVQAVPLPIRLPTVPLVAPIPQPPPPPIPQTTPQPTAAPIPLPPAEPEVDPPDPPNPPNPPAQNHQPQNPVATLQDTIEYIEVPLTTQDATEIGSKSLNLIQFRFSNRQITRC